MHPVITIFCPFTRKWAVEQWLEDLASMPHDPALTNLAIIIDIDEPYILRTLRQYAEKNGYRKFVFKMNDDWHPNEVRIAVRRLRIADVKNQSKDLIAQCDGDYVLSFEDDTVFTGMDINRLIEPLQRDENVGFVEGVQCGRWGVKMVGAWSADDYEYPQKVETLLPGEGYQEIDGGGWYGYMTPRSLYLQHDYYSSSAQPYGPDVNYGLWLRTRGYKCLIDWQTVFGHNDHNKIIWPHNGEPIAKISYTKDTNGRWSRQDAEPRR